MASEPIQCQNDEPSEPAEKPGPDNAEAAGPSIPQPTPVHKQSDAGETVKPPASESEEVSNANTEEEDTAEAGRQQPTEPKGKAKQQLERQPVDARVTVEYDRGGDGYMHRTPAASQPIMSYNVARPSPSAYYAAPPAPAPAPTPMARPGPSQGYSDEPYNTGRPSPYEQPHYYPPQPSPYSYPYQPAAASSEDNYYYSAPPQRSAFSPPRDGYGDMFNDENANSCTVT